MEYLTDNLLLRFYFQIKLCKSVAKIYVRHLGFLGKYGNRQKMGKKYHSNVAE